MFDFLQQEFLSNKLLHYVIILLIISILLIIKKRLAHLCASFVFKLFGSKNNRLSKTNFLSLVVNPLSNFIIFFVVIVCLDKLVYPKALRFTIFKTSSQTIIDSISNGILVWLFIIFCIRIIDFFAHILANKVNIQNYNTDYQLIVFFKDFFKVILIGLGILLTLHFSFHKNIGNLLTGLSIVGAALALATRESLENLIASFVIFFDKPFATGDIVKVNQYSGTIEKIGLRSTRIRTEQKTFITVPNKQMVDSIVDNISLRTQRRGDFKIEIEINTSIDLIEKFIQQLNAFLKTKEIIIQSKVQLVDVGKKCNYIEVEFFTDVQIDIDHFNEVKETIAYKILEIGKKENLSFYNPK